MGQGTLAPGRRHGMSDIRRRIVWYEVMILVHHGLKKFVGEYVKWGMFGMHGMWSFHLGCIKVV